MAINTRSRRAAILGIAQAITLTLPLSDGVVGQEDRVHVAFCYPGISPQIIMSHVSIHTENVAGIGPGSFAQSGIGPGAFGPTGSGPSSSGAAGI